MITRGVYVLGSVCGYREYYGARSIEWLLQPMTFRQGGDPDDAPDADCGAPRGLPYPFATS